LIPQLSPREVAAWLNDASREAPLLLDVREPWEFAHCHIKGSLLIPLQTLPSHLSELPEDRDIVIVCHHGNRSQNAAAWLQQKGYARVHNLSGGVESWANEVDPQMPRY
jgi:rhodanese-related sulfurtransferase